MSYRGARLGHREDINHFDIPHERKQLYCRLLRLWWANEPEALFRRTEVMSIILAFSAVGILYKLSHTQSRGLGIWFSFLLQASLFTSQARGSFYGGKGHPFFPVTVAGEKYWWV
jgi:hypothetical protein